MAHMIVPKNTNFPILATIDQYARRRWKRTSNPKSRYMMACPLPGHNDAEHPDHSGSFAVNAEGTVFHCFGCGEGGNHYQLFQLLSGQAGNASPPHIPRPPQRNATSGPQWQPRPPLQGATIHDVALAKGLDENHLRQNLSWKDTNWKDTKRHRTPAIEIPYLDENNSDAQLRYRVGIDRGVRFLWQRGSNPRLYGLWKLPFIKERNFCVLVEGETDYTTLDYHGFPVLGVPGASSFKGEWATKYLADIPQVFVWQEHDKGGINSHRRW